MRRLVSLMVGLVVLMAAGAAFAQQEEPDTQFIEFSEQQIEGETDGPGMIVVEGHDKAEFAPLGNVEKRSFMEDVKQSRNELD